VSFARVLLPLFIELEKAHFIPRKLLLNPYPFFSKLYFMISNRGERW